MRDGRLLPLAVSARDRASGFRTCRPRSRPGFPNSDYALWLGIFVPANTPRAIVDRLHDESIKALQSPALRDRLAGLDVEPMVMTTADEFDAFIRDEVVSQRRAGQAAGLKPGQ